MSTRAGNAAPLAVGEPPQAPPAELRAALMPGVPAIIEAAIAEIRSRGALEAYSQEAVERNLRLGLTDAVDRWFEPGRPSSAPDLLLALMIGGLAGTDCLAAAEDHELELLLANDPVLGARFAGRRLAPLSSVPGLATRTNLALTLRAWLRSPGQRKTIAHELGVHPQRVRYRMARLRELFGELLDEPDGRFELELALRLAPFSAPPHDAAAGTRLPASEAPEPGAGSAALTS